MLEALEMQVYKGKILFSARQEQNPAQKELEEEMQLKKRTEVRFIHMREGRGTSTLLYVEALTGCFRTTY